MLRTCYYLLLFSLLYVLFFLLGVAESEIISPKYEQIYKNAKKSAGSSKRRRRRENKSEFFADKSGDFQKYAAYDFIGAYSAESTEEGSAASPDYKGLTHSSIVDFFFKHFQIVEYFSVVKSVSHYAADECDNKKESGAYGKRNSASFHNFFAQFESFVRSHSVVEDFVVMLHDQRLDFFYRAGKNERNGCYANQENDAC